MENGKVKEFSVSDVEVWSRGLSADQLVRLTAAAVNENCPSGKILFDRKGKLLKDIPAAEYREDNDNCNVHAHVHDIQIHCGSEEYFKGLGFGIPTSLTSKKKLREDGKRKFLFIAINGYTAGMVELEEAK